MGDLLGSPSVAPSPLFCTALWGEGAATSLATALTLPDGAEPDCVGIRGLPRGAGGDRSVVNTAARGRERNRGGVYTALRSAVGGRRTYAFLSVLFLLFFSCFLPRFFAFFFASGRGALLRGPSCGIRHRPEKWQSHPAPCGAAEERRANAGSVRFGSSAPGGRPPLPHGSVMSVEEGEGA
jgi:hypothetical protein